MWNTISILPGPTLNSYCDQQHFKPGRGVVFFNDAIIGDIILPSETSNINTDEMVTFFPGWCPIQSTTFHRLLLFLYLLLNKVISFQHILNFSSFITQIMSLQKDVLWSVENLLKYDHFFFFVILKTAIKRVENLLIKWHGWWLFF